VSGTRIEDVFHRSPMRIMFPRTLNSEVREAVLLNTAGGVAGGDRLECEVTAMDGASLAVTSQAAEKVYRALREPALIATRLAARTGARLAWLPQETILFDRARLRRQTEVEVSQDDTGQWLATAIEYQVSATGRTEKEALARVMEALAAHIKKAAK